MREDCINFLSNYISSQGIEWRRDVDPFDQLQVPWVGTDTPANWVASPAIALTAIKMENILLRYRLSDE